MSRVDDSDGEEIRAAFAALETSVYAALPPKYFDELASNIVASLAAAEPLDDAGEPARMTERENMAQSIRDPDAASADREQSARSERPSQRPRKDADADAGLDDIRALAAATKNRISKQMVAQAAEEEMLLSSSSAALRAVALPEPSKFVSAHAGEERGVPKAAAVSPAAARGGGMPAWVYAFVGMAVAAAIVFLLMRGGPATEATQIAQAPATSQAAGMEPAAAASAEPTVAAIAELPSGSGQGQELGAVEGAGSGATGESGDASGRAGGAGNAPAVVASADSAKKSAEDATRDVRRRGMAEEEPGKPGSPKDAPADKASKGDAPAEAEKAAAAAAEAPPKKQGDALEDLLAEASGGVASGGAAAKPESAAPQRTSLDRGDVQKAMEAVKGKVQGCYEKHKQTGNVMVSFSVEPSGQVSSAKATGSFAGTETGSCVAEAVQSAKFPEFAGSKMSFTYPFLLTQ